MLQGFTIQNGGGNYADPDDNGTFYTYGGGIYCKGSSPVLRDLIVTNNTGDEIIGLFLITLLIVLWLFTLITKTVSEGI